MLQTTHFLDLLSSQKKQQRAQLPRSISSLAVRGDATYASCGGAGIVECHRVHVKGTYSLPSSAAAPASNLLVLGDWLLATTTLATATATAAASEGAPLVLRGALVRWRIGAFGAPSAVLDLGGVGVPSSSSGSSEAEEEDFSRPTALCHPPAYVDKVLVAFAGGGLQLWNVAAGAKLHTFRNHHHHRQSRHRSIAAAHRLHVLSGALAVAAFFAEDLWPRLPFVHSTWHVLSALAMAATEPLVDDAEARLLRGRARAEREKAKRREQKTEN